LLSLLVLLSLGIERVNFFFGGRTTLGSFASSVWELLTEGGGISLVGRHLEALLPLSAGR